MDHMIAEFVQKNFKAFNTTFILILFFLSSNVFAQDELPKFYIGQVDVLTSIRPKIVYKPVACYVVIESLDPLSADASELNVDAEGDLLPKLRVSSYLPLPHLEDINGEDDQLTWISVGPFATNLINNNGRNLYRFQDSTPAALIQDLILFLDSENQFLDFAIRYWHHGHYDPVNCKNLVEQTSDEEIDMFMDAFSEFSSGLEADQEALSE